MKQSGTLKRIAFFDCNKTFGGSDQVLFNNLKYLNKQNILPIVITAKNKGLIDRLVQLGIKVIELPKIGIARGNKIDTLLAYCSIFKAYSLCKCNHLDLLVFDRMVLLPYALILAKLLKKPLIFYLHKLRPHKSIFKRLIKLVDRIIIPADIVRQSLIDLGCDPSKINLILNSIELTGSRDKENDVYNIGMFGRFDPVKNHEAAIEAIAQMDRNIPVRLNFFGDHNEPSGSMYISRLKELIRKYGIAEKVIWHGWKNDNQKYLARMSVVILPSRSELMPMVALEAMAMKIPVIVTSNSGLKDYFKNDSECIIIDPDDVGSLVSALRSIYNDKNRSASMAQQAYAKVVKDFNIKTNIIELEKVLSGI